MKYLLIFFILFGFSFAKYDVIYYGVKLGEIKDMETIKENYIEIKITNKLAKFFSSKETFVLHNENFDKNITIQENTQYKKDKYQVLNIIKLATTQNISYKKFDISKDKYIELWYDKKYYFKYTSKKRVKSEGYLIIKGETLISLIDTKNNIQIILN